MDNLTSGCPGFQKELAGLLNKYGWDNTTNTPDYILATYLHGSLIIFHSGVESRDKHEGIERNKTIQLEEGT